MRIGVKGHSRWRLMVGHILGGATADQEEKKECGLKMAVDDGSVFFGGRPLTQGGKDRGRSETRDCNDGVGNVAFNDSCINTNQLE